MEVGIKSKEARKYIFNCLDDMMQVKPCSCFLAHSVQHVRTADAECCFVCSRSTCLLIWRGRTCWLRRLIDESLLTFWSECSVLMPTRGSHPQRLWVTLSSLWATSWTILTALSRCHFLLGDTCVYSYRCAKVLIEMWPLNISVPCSVKSCFQNMEFCKRRSSYDSGKSMYSASAVPSAAAGNLTVTFSSQLNQHNQVQPTGFTISNNTFPGLCNFPPCDSGVLFGRCLLRGERCLCWTISQLSTSRRLSTFPDLLNRVSRFPHVLLGCVARQNLSSRLSSSVHPPLFKVTVHVDDAIACVTECNCLKNARKPPPVIVNKDCPPLWLVPNCVH